MRRSPSQLCPTLFSAALLALGGTGAGVWAQTAPVQFAEAASVRPAQQKVLIRAARDDAIERLLAQIASEPVAPDLSAGQLLDAIGPQARDRMRRFLLDSPQLGGPRFAAPGTAQVQLQAQGGVVAGELMRLADDRTDRKLPQGLTRPRLAALLGTWSNRTFVATGRSVSPQTAERAVPVVFGADLDGLAPLDLGGDGTVEENGYSARLWEAWAGVGEAGRQQAFEEARRDVVDQLIRAARDVVLLEADDAGDDNGRTWTLGDAFELGGFEESSRRWLASQPVTRITFYDDQRLEMRVSVEPREWVAHLRQFAEGADGPPDLPTIPERRWAAVATQLAEAIPEEPVGATRVSAIDSAEEDEEDEENPLKRALSGARSDANLTPSWSAGPITTQGSAVYDLTDATNGLETARARLRAARAAEENAREVLRRQLGDLSLGARVTLSDVISHNEAAEAVVDAAVRDAEVENVQYAPNRQVRVTLRTEGRDLWQHLLTVGNGQP